MSIIGNVSEVDAAFITECIKSFREALLELIAHAPERERFIVIGCSTSEVVGGRIGSQAHPALGEGMAKAALHICQAEGIAIAAQCCEHLNRALVVEEASIIRYNLNEVSAIPTPEAGGSFAAGVFRLMGKPTLAEAVSANMGIDMGDTMIGMHMKRVAVPLRLDATTIGHAHVTAAVSRPPYIGGPRANYTVRF